MSTPQRSLKSDAAVAEFQQIYDSWDQALARNDPDALIELYATDATLESPLVPHILGSGQGILKGHAELRPFFELISKRKPHIRGHYRTAFLTDGKNKMIFEYPRATPHGEQMDFIEVMEVKDGLIQHHRVYWGWFGFKVLHENAYYR